MTPERLTELLEQMDLTQTGAAAELGVGIRSVHSWIAGDRPPPDAVAMLLELCVGTDSTLAAARRRAGLRPAPYHRPASETLRYGNAPKE